MLAANEAVAEYMCKRELPTVYRVHENPDPDKLRVFAAFARPFGYRIDPSKPEDTFQFQTVLRGAKTTPSNASCRRCCCAALPAHATRMSASGITA